jgi:hypothetical protein
MWQLLTVTDMCGNGFGYLPWQLLTVIDMYGNGFGYLPSVAILDDDCLATPDGY